MPVVVAGRIHTQLLVPLLLREYGSKKVRIYQRIIIKKIAHQEVSQSGGRSDRVLLQIVDSELYRSHPCVHTCFYFFIRNFAIDIAAFATICAVCYK